MYQKLKFHIEGVSPLIMHNGQMADQGNTYARQLKEVTSKRKKTDADYDEMARIEWFGGLYLLDGEPSLPGFVFEAALIGKGGAARQEKQGKAAAAGLFVTEDFPLEYDGLRDPEKMWEDGSFRDSRLVNVQRAKIMRTRPIFKEWNAAPVVEFDAVLINRETVERWVNVAGRLVGLMDYRPKYGRFSVVSCEVV